ncbi:MAG: hypothetical protein KY393_00090 [Actinobacteria bacterium]|nr:hypothetical protein [Actinomycetota bacterium]
MKRLLLGWMTALFLIALTATPAGARSDEPPGVYITSPSDGETLSGGTNIEAYAVPRKKSGLILSQDEKIESITVTIQPRGNGSSESITKPGSDFNASWNTNSLTPYNGVYDLTAKVNSDHPDPETASTSGLKVNNPPAAPTGVSASLKDKTPVVTWKANTEPDLTGYRVLRAVASASFEQIGSVKSNKFTDSDAPADVPLRYQVVAVRSSPVSDSGITAKSSATKPVTVPSTSAPQGEGAAEGEGTPAGEIPEEVFVPETTTAEPEPEPENAPPPTRSSGNLAPIIRDVPLAETNVDFEEQLPFDGELPERFNSSDTPSINAAQSAATDDGGATVVSPMKFIAAGLFLLVFSIILARTSRRLFKANPGGGGSKSPQVSYPAFRISRSQ